MESIITVTPIIVMTPVNNWLNVWTIPDWRESTSFVILDNMSPLVFISKSLIDR